MSKHSRARFDRSLAAARIRGRRVLRHSRQTLQRVRESGVRARHWARTQGNDSLRRQFHDRLVHSRRSLDRLRHSAAHHARQRPLRALSLVSLLVALLLAFMAGTITLLPRLAGASTTYQPNTYSRFTSTGDAWERGRDPFATVPPTGMQAANGKPPDKADVSSGAPLTHPIGVSLDAQRLYNGADPVGSPSAATAVKSSEGILELQVADHAVDIGKASVPGAGFLGSSVAANQAGPLTLELKPTTGTFRGQGMTLAGFALHVVDGQAREAQGVSLHAPLLLTFHYKPHELDGLNSQSLRLVWPATADQQHNRPAASVPVTEDTQSLALTASVSSLPSGPMMLSAMPGDASPASSEHLALSANQGDATFSVPIDIPPAAGGLAPNLKLVYSSAGPNGRYARNAPAPWTGDGWNLSLGSISFDSAKGLYYLNGVGGVSEVLLCCHDTNTNGVNYFVPHHHADVRIFTSDNSKSPYQTGSSFIVRMPNGIEYDLGATPDSIRSTVTSGVKTYTEWDVNKVQRVYDTGSGPGALQQYTVSYWQDWSSSGGVSYTRDAGLREIDYNFSGGSPLARVAFNVHWPGSTTTTGPATATSYGTNYNCSGTPLQVTTLRCDDPIQPSGYETPPLTMSTLTLDSVVTQAQSGGGWHTVRAYQLTYAGDSATSACWDDVSGLQYACAGEHLLASVQEIPYQNDTAAPSRQPITFSYSGPTKNEYHDTTYNGFDGHAFDAQTWWQYLTSFSDKQTGTGMTVQYKAAYGNTHGVPSGSVTDPFTCDSVSCTTVPEDRQWPRQAVANITDTGTGTTTTYAYALNQACGPGCTQDTWIPPNAWNACGDVGQPPSNPNQACLTGGYTNYYQEEYTGFLQTYATHPDGSTSYVEYYAGNGWGTDDWDPNNLARPAPLVQDEYQGAASGTPLREVWHTYATGGSSCPTGVSGNNQLYNNPYIFCLLQETATDVYLGGGSGSSPAVPHETVRRTYDPYIWFQMLTASAVTTNDLIADSSTNYGSTQPTFTTKYGYTGRDGASESPQTPYLFEELAQSAAVDDTLGNRWACSQTLYDGLGYLPDYRQSSIKEALPTQGNTYSDCGTSGNGYTQTGGVSTGAGYDPYGQPVLGVDADALAGIGGHIGCVPGGSILVAYPTNWSQYSGCTTYDSAQHAYPTTRANALNQQSSTAWDTLQGVPTSTTDPNGAITSFAGPFYEYSGGPSLATYQDTYAQTTLPLEGYGSPAWTARVYTFSFCAGATTGGKPCAETDSVRQVDGTNLLVSRQFYDRDGRLVETRVSGPTVGQDTVAITAYDDAHTKVFSSLPCSVPALSTSNGGRTVGSTPNYIAPTQTSSGSSAYVDPGVSGTSCYNIGGTTTYRDALGRATASDDAIGTGVGTSGSGCVLPGGNSAHTTCAAYTPVVASSTSGLPSSDGEPYFQTLTIDANLHQSASYSDALGQTAYAQRFSGASQTPRGAGISSYSVTSYKYDGAGNLTKITDPASLTTSFSYDKLGRQTALGDPDRGAESYSYDANGNVTATVDARGAGSGAIYAGYDGLNRQLWRNTTNSPTGAYATYSYDSTSGGDKGVGRLTGETFSGTLLAGAASGAYAYVYDARGRATSSALTLGSSSYPTSASYTDLDTLATQTYPTGETVTTASNAAGAFAGLTRTLGGTPTTLVDTLTYNASGLLASARVLGAYAMTTSYDGLLRPANHAFVRLSDSATVYAESPTYDNVGNVSGVSTQLPTGTDVQRFCYDEQNRLVGATATDSAPSTCPSMSAFTPGSLSGAAYVHTFGYDALDRLVGGPIGAYSYTDSAHEHALTSASAGYSAAYDASGNMTCRAPSSATTCAGTQTGAQLAYDNEGRLAAWQNTPSSPTATAKYLYDGEGQRVEGQTSSGGTTTTSVYVGAVEEVVTSGSSTTTYTYYYTPDGTRIAEAINGGGPFVLGTDLLGTSQTVLLANGTSTASALYSPYGIPRYGSGAMPTDYGFTGQHSDLGTTGLDYYNARYFDPTAAQFGAADTALDGASPPNRFSYVRGNPQTATDPSGHYCMLAVMCGLGGGGAGGGGEILSPWTEPPDPSRTGGGQRSPTIPDPIPAPKIGDDSPDPLMPRRPIFSHQDGPDPTHQGIHPVAPTSSASPTGAPQSAPQTQPGGGGGSGQGGGDKVGAGGGACGSGDGGGSLYRGLRADEDPSQGLYPRKPGRGMSAAGHVLNGSNPSFQGSQFISTSRSLDIAFRFSSRVAEIDPTRIVGTLIDLSTSEGRLAAGLTSATPGRNAWWYAQRAREVLIDGHVPPEAITNVYDRPSLWSNEC